MYADWDEWYERTAELTARKVYWVQRATQLERKLASVRERAAMVETLIATHNNQRPAHPPDEYTGE